MTKSEFDVLLEKAKSGDAKAQYEVAAQYLIGQVVEKNVRAALEWTQKSADQNYADGVNCLGAILNMFTDTPKPKIAEIFERAFSLGSKKVAWNLAQSYVYDVNQWSKAIPLLEEIMATDTDRRKEHARRALEQMKIWEKLKSVFTDIDKDRVPMWNKSRGYGGTYLYNICFVPGGSDDDETFCASKLHKQSGTSSGVGNVIAGTFLTFSKSQVISFIDEYGAYMNGEIKLSDMKPREEASALVSVFHWLELSAEEQEEIRSGIHQKEIDTYGKIIERF